MTFQVVDDFDLETIEDFVDTLNYIAIRRERQDSVISLSHAVPKITVKEPTLHDTWKGKYTSYLFCITTAHPAFHISRSAVRRRYSECRWLYKALCITHKKLKHLIPKPPPKHIFRNRFKPAFIEERMEELGLWINSLMLIDECVSDAAFHLFVQTDLTTKEMDVYFSGKCDDDLILAAWKNAGHVHDSSFMVCNATIKPEPIEISMNEEDLLPRRESVSQSMSQEAPAWRRGSDSSRTESSTDSDTATSEDGASTSGASGCRASGSRDDKSTTGPSGIEGESDAASSVVMSQQKSKRPRSTVSDHLPERRKIDTSRRQPWIV